MKKIHLQYVLIAISIVGCSRPASKATMEKWKAEIHQAEKDFNDMAQEEGLTKAFAHFAAEDGVIRRGKKVIKGKKDIEQWYQNDVRPNETLTWTPTFIDVSDSGDLAYTYGDYVFASVDSTGTTKESKGIFHTVWKRQADGTWRFVWD